MTRLEFHEYIDVAIRSKIVAKHRAEQGESFDVVTPAKCRHGVSVDRNVWAHGFVHDTPSEMARHEQALVLTSEDRVLLVSDVPPARGSRRRRPHQRARCGVARRYRSAEEPGTQNRRHDSVELSSLLGRNVPGSVY